VCYYLVGEGLTEGGEGAGVGGVEGGRLTRGWVKQITHFRGGVSIRGANASGHQEHAHELLLDLKMQAQ
jgi:hypothetical protein